MTYLIVKVEIFYNRMIILVPPIMHSMISIKHMSIPVYVFISTLNTAPLKYMRSSNTSNRIRPAYLHVI